MPKIGYELPVSLKEFYQNLRSDRLCLALGWFFQPLYFDANPYQSALYTFQDNPNTVKFAFSGKKRLPIIDDAGGSTIYLDFEPDAKGTYGQVILIFRDYPEIVFRIAKDFDEFLAIMNNEFEQKRVKIDGDKESEDAHLIYEQHNDYFDWVSLSRAQRGVSKIGTDKPMNFDAAWIRALSSKNQEFTRKQAANFLESDLDRVYYVWIFDENIESIEKLALFPNLAQVGFSLKNKTIPQKAWETLAKTRVTSLIINNLLPNSSLDMAQIAKLSHLVELRCGELAASLEDVKNAPYINNNYPFLNVSHIEKLTQLRFLSLSDSTLKNLDFLEKMPQLRTFECRNARLSEPKWQAIKSLKQLIYLNVKGSNFSDFALLKDLTELQTLRFNSHNGTNYASFEQINRPLSMVCDMAFFNKMLDIIIHKKHNLMGVSGTQAERNAEYEANWRKYLASKDKK